METVTQQPAGDEVELHLLTDWSTFGDRRRMETAGFVSILSHIAVVLIVLSLSASVMVPPEVKQHLLTPLVAPITQTAPNRAKVTGEFNAVEMQPRPQVVIPPTPPPAVRAPRPLTPPPVPPAPAPAPSPAVPEPPKIQAGSQEPPRVEAPPPAPPQIEAQERPKLAFETPTAPPPSGRPTGRVPIPGSSVDDAIRGAARGSTGGVITGGDSPSGIGEAVIQPRAPGSQASNWELLSDTQGVDFKPYLTRLLTRVRRSWFAVWPESAKMGRSGRVAIQLRIARDGNVMKLVLAQPSGAEALDRAAVAGISAAMPFAPLPTEFKGGEIRIQLNFAYNVPR